MLLAVSVFFGFLYVVTDARTLRRQNRNVILFMVRNCIVLNSVSVIHFS